MDDSQGNQTATPSSSITVAMVDPLLGSTFDVPLVEGRTDGHPTSYFELTRKTAEAVQRAQGLQGAPYNGNGASRLTPSRPTSVAAGVETRSEETDLPSTCCGSRDDSAEASLHSVPIDGVSHPSPASEEQTPVASRSRHRTGATGIVSMMLVDGDDDEEAAEGGFDAALSLLFSLLQMSDAELERHTANHRGGTSALLRAASRGLAYARDDLALHIEESTTRIAALEHTLHQQQDTSSRRERALVDLARKHGAGEGEIERCLARVSEQQTAAQKVAREQRMLDLSLQEAMSEAISREDAEDMEERPESGQPPQTEAGRVTRSTHPLRGNNSSISVDSSTDDHRRKAGRKRSESMASISVVSVATSRRTEGSALTDWASGLMPWGAGSKKASASISPTSSTSIAPGELTVGNSSTEDEADSADGTASVKAGHCSSSSRASSSSQARASSRRSANTLSIFGGIAWRRTARQAPSDAPNAEVEEDHDISTNAGDEHAPSTAVQGLRAVTAEMAASGASIQTPVREAFDASDLHEHGEDTVKVKAPLSSPQLRHVLAVYADSASAFQAEDVRSTSTNFSAPDLPVSRGLDQCQGSLEPTLVASQVISRSRTSAAEGLRLGGSTSVDPLRALQDPRTLDTSKERTPNVTRLPQIYGNASTDPYLPLTPAPVKTLELQTMVPKEARPPTLAGQRLVSASPYEHGADPFEVYGGSGQELPEAGPGRPSDTSLTDRYGFMYCATPSDLRMLRQARAASTVAPAPLAGTRVEPATDSEEETDSAGSIEAIKRPPASCGSSFIMGHAEKAKAMTQASSINVSTRTNEEETAERRSTVKHLLKQLDEMYDEQQAQQRIKWDSFLKERQDKMQTLRRKPRKALPLQDEAAEGLLDATLTLVGIAQMGTTKTGKEDWRHFLKLCISGIPLSYRSQVWSECSGVNEMAEPGRYEELLSEHNGEQNQCLTQIDLDVHRTMPTNVFFGGDGPGVPKLRRVLVAFSWYDVEIGYCQAMNNIAATLLLTEPSESKSFWLLVCLIEKIMPRDYYTSHLLTSQADQRVLIEYTGELLPKIWAHIEGLGVDLPAVTFAWFLSLYTDCLPVEVLFRVWDLLFVEGMVTLFRVALAILELHEEAILETQSAAAFYSLMHRTTGQLFHADKLVQAASTLRDRVKHTDITSRRTYHIDALRQELGL